MTPIAIASLKVAGLYAAVFIVMGIVLAMLVIVQRRSKLVGIGDGGDKDLARAVRVHGNFMEHMPQGFAALILLPLLGAGTTLVHVVGGLLLLGRLMHAVGLRRYSGSSTGRVGGMVISQVALLIAVGGIISLVL